MRLPAGLPRAFLHILGCAPTSLPTGPRRPLGQPAPSYRFLSILSAAGLTGSAAFRVTLLRTQQPARLLPGTGSPALRPARCVLTLSAGASSTSSLQQVGGPSRREPIHSASLLGWAWRGTRGPCFDGDRALHTQHPGPAGDRAWPAGFPEMRLAETHFAYFSLQTRGGGCSQLRRGDAHAAGLQLGRYAPGGERSWGRGPPRSVPPPPEPELPA